MKKNIIAASIAGLSLLLSVTGVMAHAVVKPNMVGVGAFQTFTLGVPNEKEVSYNQIRILIPEGVEFVSPNVKTGWRITTKTTKADPESEARVTEITWSGGIVPAGQRDDFSFSAKVPASETTLQWKAYQTYSDGMVVSWDQAAMPNMSDDDKEKMEKEGKGPYSETKIVNDLKPSGATSVANQDGSQKGSNALPYLAIVLSVVALGMQFRKKN